MLDVVAGVPASVSPAIATDSAGNLFYTTFDSVFKRTPAAEVMPITTATFVMPLGIAADGAGNVFMVERGEGFRGGDVFFPAVQRIDRHGQVTKVSGNLSDVSDAIPPPIAAGLDGSYYVSVVGTLRKVTPSGTVVNVTAPEVRRSIDHIAIDAKGNVYFGHDGMVKKIAPGQAEVLLADGFQLGTGFNIRAPLMRGGLAVDSAENVYVANTGDHTIKKISPAGIVTTVAGQPGVAGHEMGPLPGKLNAPRGLALQGDKTLYVTSGGALLRIDLP